MNKRRGRNTPTTQQNIKRFKSQSPTYDAESNTFNNDVESAEEHLSNWEKKFKNEQEKKFLNDFKDKFGKNIENDSELNDIMHLIIKNVSNNNETPGEKIKEYIEKNNGENRQKYTFVNAQLNSMKRDFNIALQAKKKEARAVVDTQPRAFDSV